MQSYRHGALLLSIALAVLLYAQGLLAQSSPVVFPTFIWSTEKHIAGGLDGQTSRVSYELLPQQTLVNELLPRLVGAEAAGAKLVHLLNATELQALPPQLVVLFLGQQWQTEHLAAAAAAQDLEPLQRALAGASSSLSLPNIVQGGGSLLESSLAFLEMRGSLHTLGACSGAAESSAVPATAEAARDAVLGLPSNRGTQVLVVCSGSGTLGGEMALLDGVAAAAAASRRPHAFLFSSVGPPQAARRRALLSRVAAKAAKPSFVCDAKCETQVKLLESFILAVTLIMAVLTGTCMLHGLGTPTRFETPKGDRTAHRD